MVIDGFDLNYEDIKLSNAFTVSSSVRVLSKTLSVLRLVKYDALTLAVVLLFVERELEANRDFTWLVSIGLLKFY